MNHIGNHTANTEGFDPEYMRLSLFEAEVLGLLPGRSCPDARPDCLCLLPAYPEGCQASCSYCGLTRYGENGKQHTQEHDRWPAYPLAQIIAAAKERKGLERFCVSMITHPRAMDDTLTLVERLAAGPGLPVSVLANPTMMDSGDLSLLKDAGTDLVAVAVGAAAPQLFDRHRGAAAGGPHRWDRFWLELERAAAVFGRGKFVCHLIAGLGETELQMMETVQKMRNLGGTTHLFPFHPREDSLLNHSASCPAGLFRRVQLGRFLIDYDLASWEQMEFDEEDRIVGFGLAGAPLDELVGSGRPFTAGACPGRQRDCACSLPLGGGLPDDISGYPFALGAADIQSVRKQLATYTAVQAPWVPAKNR